jgi:hypothetical protein
MAQRHVSALRMREVCNSGSLVALVSYFVATNRPMRCNIRRIMKIGNLSRFPSLISLGGKASLFSYSLFK